MKLYQFDNAWDWHGIGAFVVLASSPAAAARKLNRWLRLDHSKEDVGYFPGLYDKGKNPQRYTPDDAAEVTSGVFVASGCDD